MRGNRRLYAVLARPALFHVDPQARDGLRFELGNARLMQMNHLRNLPQRQLILVIQVDHSAVHGRHLLDGLRQQFFQFAAFEQARGSKSSLSETYSSTSRPS